MRRGLRLAPVLLLVVAGACGHDSHQVPEHHGSLGFLHDDPAEAPLSPPPGPVPPGLAEIESVPVDLQGEAFRVATRAGDLVTPPVQAPCSQCHDPEKPGRITMPPGVPLDARGAHWQVTTAHGSAPLACASCHAPEDPARLRVPTVVAALSEDDPSEAVWALEHSYRVCGTCHFSQLRDWAGGAHGKRLAGWGGPRVVAPCTACHDPHAPGLPVRLPATTSPPPERRHR